MYLEHFGLEQAPFRITPDTRVFYSGGDRGAVLEALAWAVESGEGIVKVVGEVGSGKTMLATCAARRTIWVPRKRRSRSFADAARSGRLSAGGWPRWWRFGYCSRRRSRNRSRPT